MQSTIATCDNNAFTASCVNSVGAENDHSLRCVEANCGYGDCIGQNCINVLHACKL